MPTDNRAEELVHQDVLQDDCAPSELIPREFEEGRTGLGIGISYNLVEIES